MNIRHKIYNSLDIYYNEVRTYLHARSRLDADKVISRYFTDKQIKSFKIRFGSEDHMIYIKYIIRDDILSRMFQDLNQLQPKLRKEYNYANN